MTLVAVEDRGPARWILFDRPEKRNALSPDMIAEVLEVLHGALEDSSVRAVVLSGRGPAFCAGADLQTGKELAAAGEGAPNPFAVLLRDLQHAPVPVIAAVNGPAFGGGLGLVAAADIVLAAKEAVFSFSEVRLGLIPAMISVVVLPKIGPHQARRLFLTGRRFSASEAVDVGLVHRVVAGDELAAAVAEEVDQIARGGPRAVAEAKRLIHEIPGLTEDEAFAEAARRFADCVGSEEGQEGMAAFVEKRAPGWRA